MNTINRVECLNGVKNINSCAIRAHWRTDRNEIIESLSEFHMNYQADRYLAYIQENYAENLIDAHKEIYTLR